MTLQEKVVALSEEVEKYDIPNAEALEAFRMDFISRKSKINALFSEFKNVSGEEKKTLGKDINILKNKAEAKFRAQKQAVEEALEAAKAENIDLSLPPIGGRLGSMHPITLVREEIVSIFERMGFNLSEGPEIEKDHYNFSALNFPENHPAREMQDTFFTEKDPDVVLRTHTSSVQIRVMEAEELPLRTLSVGRVYRNETISSRSLCTFHQIEGLYVDKNVSFADLKQTIYHFAQEFFGKGTKIRLRPSYFPFTEPSAEVDIYWGLKDEVDYRITKGTGWLEIMGCGMVHPNVLKNCNIDPEEYTGFAFGMGIERIALHKFRIPDIRMLQENDVRFLKQFQAVQSS